MLKILRLVYAMEASKMILQTVGILTDFTALWALYWGGVAVLVLQVP